MKISGFQKLTLLDFPGRVAATVFTSGCNFRCPFCHNAGLVTNLSESPEISKEEIFSYLKKRKGVLDGVCITGGEPLLNEDIGDFLSEIREMGYKIKLDTNGSFPERLRSLCSRGLCDYVAMDIKNSKERYAETVGLPDFDVSAVCESVRYLMSGACDYEFRTTVTRELHTEQDIESLSQWIKGARRYFLQNFVDSGNILGKNLSALPAEKLEIMRKIARRYIDDVSLRGV